MENASLPVSIVRQVKVSRNLKIFCANIDFLIYNINNELPIVSAITGDFNARFSKWCNNDITNSVGRVIDPLTLSAGYKKRSN